MRAPSSRTLRWCVGFAAVLMTHFWGPLGPHEVAAQGADAGPRSAQVTRANSSIVVDGVLDEPAWNNAPPIGDLIQREPRPGETPTEKTEVRLLYGDGHLYVGVWCFDSEPDKMIGTLMARDADLQVDDRIEIVLDTFRDRRNAYYFATNPAGALVDGLVIENGRLNREWDAIWEVRTKRITEGWTAEFAIPFKSLSFLSGQATWGFNVSRSIKRKIEEDRWSGARLELQFLQVSEAGEITGLEEVSQGIGLDVRPFAAGGWLHDNQSGNDTVTGKLGLDVFYNVTPNLKWSTTVNTDFGETEVDARQVNLTRFPLFFPEKRSFFLENAGVFDFSNTASATRGSDRLFFLPFFSRRIGLLNGREVPILVGTKLTGKVGQTDIGALTVRTRETAFVEAKNFFVGRIKQEFFRQSYVGAMFTDGDPELPTSARTFGVDLRLATSRFLGRNRTFQVDVSALKSNNEGVQGDDAALGFSAAYPNELLNVEYTWRQIGRNFRPALGFVPRNNVRFNEFRFDYAPRPEGFLNVRRMSHQFFFTHYIRLDNGQIESWRIQAAPINWQFNSGDRVEFNYAPQFERLFAPFEISDGVILPPGDYRFTRWRIEAFTASKRKLEARVTWWFGTFWSGHADQIQTFLQYKIPPRFVINFSTNQTFATLQEGNFVARVLSWSVNFSASPYLTFSNLLQYDNESRNLGWQSRVRWILHPGNDMFVVFNQGWIQEEDGGFRYRAEEGKVSAKFQYTFRF